MPEERYVSCALILTPVLTLLERHYSYECKATTQERPYVSRPSRSQQLRNPKLVPKLTNETLNPLEKKYVDLASQFFSFTNSFSGKVLLMQS